MASAVFPETPSFIIGQTQSEVMQRLAPDPAASNRPRLCFALLALATSPLNLANARPSVLRAPAPFQVVLADFRPPELVASAPYITPYPVVLADASEMK